jgi:hypothetical protein
VASSAPIAALVVAGVVIVFLGLFAAGSVELIALGIAALAVAGALGVAVDRRAAG